ncbi:MAG: FeoA family protein [Proteobacteria bacterium]|nr:FeoA family protein [Pseudomonadota bacterium]
MDHARRPGAHLRVVAVNGERGFRRRLLEMGLVPGVEFKVISIAPLGDPWQIEVRGGRWSLRRAEAEQLVVVDVT